MAGSVLHGRGGPVLLEGLETGIEGVQHVLAHQLQVGHSILEDVNGGSVCRKVRE